MNEVNAVCKQENEITKVLSSIRENAIDALGLARDIGGVLFGRSYENSKEVPSIDCVMSEIIATENILKEISLVLDEIRRRIG